MSAWNQLYMCNQAAGLVQCLAKVQYSMVTWVKIIQIDKAKGKSCSKSQDAADELDYLITFNRSITQAMATAMQDLSEGVFMANLTLTCRDTYIDYLKAGIK